MTLPQLAGAWSWRRTRFSLVGGVQQTVAPADNTRWLIGFLGNVDGARVAPWNPELAATVDAFLVSTKQYEATFTYRDYGGIVGAEWIGFTPAFAVDLLVVELLYKG